MDNTSTSSTYYIIALFFPSSGGCVGETSFHSMIPTPRPVQRSDCFHILHFSLAQSNKQKQLAHQLYLRWSSTDTTNHQSWTDHSKLDYSQSIMHSVLLFADMWHKCEVLWSRTDIFSFVVGDTTVSGPPASWNFDFLANITLDHSYITPGTI